MSEMTTAKADEKTKSELVKSAKKFRNWYANNREDFNAKRREKYSQDQDLRNKARVNSKRQRDKVSDPSIEPVLRVVSGRTLKVYRAAAAGAMIGRSPETIRTWSRNGWLPTVDDGWTHRTFTKKQIKLMQRLVNVIEKYRYAADYQQHIDKVVQSIRKQW